MQATRASTLIEEENKKELPQLEINNTVYVPSGKSPRRDVNSRYVMLALYRSLGKQQPVVYISGAGHACKDATDIAEILKRCNMGFKEVCIYTENLNQNPKAKKRINRVVIGLSQRPKDYDFQCGDLPEKMREKQRF